MNDEQRLALLRAGRPTTGERWADMGCGEGVFTRPLARLLGASGTVYAIDRDAAALRVLCDALSRAPDESRARVETRVGSIEDSYDVGSLDGVLFANVLHYLRDPAPALRTIAPSLRRGGRVLIIEYDRADGNRWVPYPIPLSALDRLARDAELSPFQVVARVRSEYGRHIYAAVSSSSAP